MISKGAFLAGSFAAVLFVQSEAQAGYAVQYENSLGNAKDNDNFGTFIMDNKYLPMFPNGIIYEGVSEAPLFLRGESGINDSIICTLDNLL